MKAECRVGSGHPYNVNREGCNVLDFSRVYIFFNCRKYQWHKHWKSYSAFLRHIKECGLSLQIIPFLALGLGVDDIFLMAHTYGENSANKHIAFDVRLAFSE